MEHGYSQHTTIWRDILSALLAMFVIVPALGTERNPQSSKESFKFTLQVTGSANVAFSARCWLKSDRGEEKFDTSGVGPLSREFIGVGVRCRVSKDSADGVLTVELRKDSRLISRSSTTALGGLISIAVQ